MNTGVHLLTYADRLAGNLQGLRTLLATELHDFTGVHILPFFTPYDGADAGFDPVDHLSVDPRQGTWDDVAAIANDGIAVTADFIVNHMSADSPLFQEWLDHGARDGLFLTFSAVFPNGATSDMITKFYRPRPGLPFTAFRKGDGSRELVWTTFMPSQVDIDVKNSEGMAYLTSILLVMQQAGISTVRIDAVGYAVKTPGTDSFMTKETLDFVRDLVETCHSFNVRVLVEVHAHYSQQLAVSKIVDCVYDFVTPALILDAFGSRSTEKFPRWFERRPQNTLSVLDTHDGIGIIDAGPGPNGEDGYLSQEEMAGIFERAEVSTHGLSAKASVIPTWFSLPHQINATFYSVLGCDDTRYIMARALQFFLPGTPQVYYVGLLAGVDDEKEFERTGEGRNVNRHRYTSEEVHEQLRRPVVKALLQLVHLRGSLAAFSGDFAFERPGQSQLRLTWTNGKSVASLDLDFETETFAITLRDAGKMRVLASVDDLVADIAASEE